MLFLILLFSIFSVEVRSQSWEPRALNRESCKIQEDFKYIVSIQRDDKHTCNGVILDKKSILTTAICCKEKLKCCTTSNCTNPHLKVVHLLAAKPGFPTGEHCLVAQVGRCIIHPFYERGKYFVEFDTCIVVLQDNLSSFITAPLVEDKNIVKDYSEVCEQGTVAGWWFHDKEKIPNSILECFPVTIRNLKRCAEVSTHIYLKKSTNHTLTCSFDASNRLEVCSAFYGAPLICRGKVVAIISHKFNFSEQCVEVSPFYYSRIDWSIIFRQNYTKGVYGRNAFIDYYDYYYRWNKSTSNYEVPYIMIFFSAMYNILTYHYGNQKICVL